MNTARQAGSRRRARLDAGADPGSEAGSSGTRAVSHDVVTVSQCRRYPRPRPSECPGTMTLPRRMLALFMLMLLSACASAPPTRTDTPTLRAMSFNVRLPVEPDGPNPREARRALAAKTIRDADPDVIGTQELHKPQGDYLVSQLPDYAWFGTSRRGDHSDEHMGVFYRRDRLRVLESGDFWLSDTPEVPGSISWGILCHAWSPGRCSSASPTASASTCSTPTCPTAKRTRTRARAARAC